jgi:hypothetical protein
LAFLTVIAGELRSQTSSLNTYNRIISWVERVVFAEDLHADDEFLESFTPTGDGLFNDEGQETLEAISLPKRLTGENSGQLRRSYLVCVLAELKRGAP